MSQSTYRARGIVLRKTKLGESDLVVTLLAEDGSQLRAVAKGARKPSSPFSARLELYSVADLLLARGRSLDIVKEARLVESNERLRLDMEHAACAAPMAELLDRVTQMGLESPRLFALTCAALQSLGRVEAAQAPAVCAAHLLKALAFAGLRPSLDVCAGCGRDVAAPALPADARVSFREGGVLCAECAGRMEARVVPQATVDWCKALLGSTFDQIEGMRAGPSEAFGALRFCQEWVREHVGAQLKSLNFLFTCGLF
ncbi:DNA repair protein RecO [Arabiibacter massiliensis]|uniref:DNA repair protein RecO n=1 Tax=Arabiibacter massiliensis TaxID=1870985 RepID=UPI0009B9E770|nr:DNA repair protein RecO [Arabiibacter massiliensis]